MLSVWRAVSVLVSVLVLALTVAAAAEDKPQKRVTVPLEELRPENRDPQKLRSRKKLSPEESRERLRELVLKIDSDDDDQVTLDELKAWGKLGHNRLPTVIAEERFTGSDKNNDSLVSWLEHLKDTFNLESDDGIAKALQGDYENKRRTMSKIKEDRDLFAAADVDDDGFLDKDEYWDFNMPEDSDALSPLLLKHQVGDRDKNQDGQLTYEEFVAPSNSYHDDPNPASTDKAFKRRDKNSDGILDEREIAKAFLHGNLDWKMEHVVHLFEEADDDGDDLLSVDEMVAYHDMFRKSPITEYGYHLDNFHLIRDEL